MKTKKILDNRYLITITGDIYSLTFRNKVCFKLRREPLKMKKTLMPNGYERITLSHKNNRIQVLFHRLMLESFVGKPPTTKHVCDHIDGNRSNNHIKNLRWVTPKQNQGFRLTHGTDGNGTKNPASKLTIKQVEKIRRFLASGGKSVDMAKWYRVSKATISNIKNNRTYQR